MCDVSRSYDVKVEIPSHVHALRTFVHVQTPRAAENFLALCASNYYNGTIFHRNIQGFMIQGGDPTGNLDLAVVPTCSKALRPDTSIKISRVIWVSLWTVCFLEMQLVA